MWQRPSSSMCPPRTRGSLSYPSLLCTCQPHTPRTPSRSHRQYAPVSRHTHMHMAKHSQRPSPHPLRHPYDRANVRMHDQKAKQRLPRCIHSPPARRSPWPSWCLPDSPCMHLIPASPCTCPPRKARTAPRPARTSLHRRCPDNALPTCSLEAMYAPPDSRRTRFPAGICLSCTGCMVLLQVLGSPLCTCNPSWPSSPTPSWCPRGTADTSFPKSLQAPPSMCPPGTPRSHPTP